MASAASLPAVMPGAPSICPERKAARAVLAAGVVVPRIRSRGPSVVTATWATAGGWAGAAGEPSFSSSSTSWATM
eukprot:3066611-Prymnesium_polylepis.3